MIYFIISALDRRKRWPFGGLPNKMEWFEFNES